MFENEKINIIDVGCYNNECGFIIEPWNSNREYINFLLGFDPLLEESFYEEEISMLNLDIKYKVLKKGAYSSNCKREFYKLRQQNCSSFYIPDKEVITRGKQK